MSSFHERYVVCKLKQLRVYDDLNAGKCNRGNNCRYSHDEEQKKQTLIKKRKRMEAKAILEANGRSGKTSLLRKLLMSDIHKEKFIILECLRHIRRTNFLQ